MKSFLSKITNLILLITFNGFVLTNLGCGGGTRGTGSLTIDGNVRSINGQPLSSIQVTNLETGETATTNSNGTFKITTESQAGELSFLLESNSFQIVSRGGGTISEETTNINVEITVDNRSNNPSANQKITITSKKPNGGSGGSSSSKSSASSSNSSTSNSSSSSTSSSSFSSSSSSNSSSNSSATSASSSSSSSSSSSNDDDQEVRAKGAIERITSTSITVKQTTFIVNGNTEIDGYDNFSDFSVGENVEVRGKFINQVLIAEEIELDD
jgi:hypothetical protein